MKLDSRQGLRVEQNCALGIADQCSDNFSSQEIRDSTLSNIDSRRSGNIGGQDNEAVIIPSLMNFEMSSQRQMIDSAISSSYSNLRTDVDNCKIINFVGEF